jgi:hypothetical protein
MRPIRLRPWTWISGLLIFFGSGLLGLALQAQPGLRLQAHLAYAEPTPAGLRAPRLELKAGSRLWLEGNSTLHPYSVEATRLLLEGTVEPSSGPLNWRIVELKVRIPVAGLKSGIEGLDRNMYRDLKADQHPEIRFILTGYTTLSPTSAEGNTIQARGRLLVAGVERDIELQAQLTISGNEIRVEGSKELFMTDFGITPRRFLGFMRVDNKITVRFALVFLVQTEQS